MIELEYYISLNSPWAYLGGQRFLDIVKRYGVTVHTKPTRFAEVFAATGGLPLPKRSPQRQAYRLMELRRWRDHLGIPIVLEPEAFPSDETAAARLVIAADQAGLDAPRLAMEIGRELWERDNSIAEESALKTAAGRAGIDYEGLTSRMADENSLDDIWHANTKDAVEKGVFGAPSFVLPSGEILWGQDRIDFLDRALAKLAS